MQQTRKQRKPSSLHAQKHSVAKYGPPPQHHKTQQKHNNISSLQSASDIIADSLDLAAHIRPASSLAGAVKDHNLHFISQSFS